MPKKKKTKENDWNSGVSPKTNLSYEKYLKAGLEIISPKLTVRSYKLAPKDEYAFFERGKDIRVAIFFDGKPVIDTQDRKYEFVVELPFWFGSNTNKEDRQWMRNHCDAHLKIFHDAVKRGKKKKSKKKTTKKLAKKTKAKIGSTQDVFEKMKSK